MTGVQTCALPILDGLGAGAVLGNMCKCFFHVEASVSGSTIQRQEMPVKNWQKVRRPAQPGRLLSGRTPIKKPPHPARKLRRQNAAAYCYKKLTQRSSARSRCRCRHQSPRWQRKKSCRKRGCPADRTETRPQKGKIGRAHV